MGELIDRLVSHFIASDQVIITYNHTDAGDGQESITNRMRSKLYGVEVLIILRNYQQFNTPKSSLWDN